MDLFAAATFFDDCPAYDAYTGAQVFLCQLSSFNDSNAIGSTSIRRVLSTGPGITIPSRRVVTLMGAQWIVGDGNDDSWDALPIRQSYNMKKASDLAVFRSPAETLQSAVGTSIYIQKAYFKDVYNLHETSDVSSDWNIFLSRSEHVATGTIVFDGSDYYRVREAYTPLEGIQVTRAYRFDKGLEPIVYAEPAYDSATDTYAEVSVNLQTLMAPAALFYYRPMESAPQAAAGDYTLYLASEPTVGANVYYNNKTYKVVAYTSEVDAYLVHIRRA